MVSSRRGVVGQTNIEVLHLDLRALLLGIVHPRHVVVQALIKIHNIIDLLYFLLANQVLAIHINFINIFYMVFLAIWNVILLTVELSDFTLMRNRKILHLV